MGVDNETCPARGAEAGVVHDLTTPYDIEQLAISLSNAMNWDRDAVSGRNWVDQLTRELGERRKRLETVLRGLQVPVPTCVDDPRLQEFDLDAEAVWGGSPLARLLEWRRSADPRGYAAGERVMRFAVATARRLGLPESDVAAMQNAALLHDLGILIIPPSLIEKPADFTSDERALVRQHPLIAFELLQQYHDLATVAPLVLSAYEGFGGQGYPHGLVGEEIPMASRILAVAIAYEAMTTARPHRGAIPSSEAVLELFRCCGTQFDPVVVGAFVHVLTLY